MRPVHYSTLGQYPAQIRLGARAKTHQSYDPTINTFLLQQLIHFKFRCSLSSLYFSPGKLSWIGLLPHQMMEVSAKMPNI